MLKLYNTLSRFVEDFFPQEPRLVTMYSCGPTVYDFQHIGHMRRYVGDDILVRTLKLNGFKVKHVMNITDVGHLVSDADSGEDKMEKGAKKFGMSVWEIAKKFEKQFFDSEELLNILKPSRIMHATDYIKEQIAFIQLLEEKGYTYRTNDGIYFDTSKFKGYNKLSQQPLDLIKPGIRVKLVEGKKHATDFALWKCSPYGEKRQMEWESPWGKGFPGWHIECSTMAIKGLETETLDIHTGGIDHIPIHHTNEIAQSEAATGKQFVKFWVHHNFLLVDDQKMSKSLGNLFTVQDIMERGYDPLSLRFLYLQTHYRQEMHFTFDALTAVENTLKKLRNDIALWQKPKGSISEFDTSFKNAINDDLNTPKAIAVLWEMVKSNNPTKSKAGSLLYMDEVLGLGLTEYIGMPKKVEKIQLPEEVERMVREREKLRREKRFAKADQLRNRVRKLGFDIVDKEKGEVEVTQLV